MIKYQICLNFDFDLCDICHVICYIYVISLFGIFNLLI